MPQLRGRALAEMRKATHRRQKERKPMNLSTVTSICSEITVILAALAMLIKPIRNKLVGQYFEKVS